MSAIYSNDARMSVEPIKLPVTVAVTDKSSTYTTQYVCGQRATSTCSAEVAAGRLVDKLTSYLGLQPGVLSARQLEVKGAHSGVTKWLISK